LHRIAIKTIKTNKTRFGATVAAMLLYILLVGAGSARARSIDGKGGAKEQEIRSRITFITDALRREERRIGTWSWLWGAGLAMASAAQFASPLLFEETGQRVTYLIGGGKSVLGVLSFVVMPVRIELPEESSNDLAAAEAALIRSASNERRGKGWFKHTAAVVLNVAHTLIVGLLYDEWLIGAISGVAGLAVGELIIYTQPTGAIEAAERYQRGSFDGSSGTRDRRWALFPTSSGIGLGFAVQY
jgi:hypothetical protein